MACSSSIIGVSIYHKNPSLEQLSRKIAAPAAPVHLPRSTVKTHFTSLKVTSKLKPNSTGVSGGSAFVASATAAPNSVLSENAFKGLGVFDEDSSLDDSDREYTDDSENEGSIDISAGNAVDDDELSITKLGLPQRLVQSLEKREITRLFPIQVSYPYPFLPFINMFSQ